MNLKKIFWAASVATFLAANFFVVGHSDENKRDESLAHYLEQLQVKLDHTAQRANQPNAAGSSVVGLRGTKQESGSQKLYWKSKNTKKPVTPEEVKAFRDSIEQARTGKTADAVTSLKAFQDKYPKSALGPDVQEALQRLSAPPTH